MGFSKGNIIRTSCNRLKSGTIFKMKDAPAFHMNNKLYIVYEKYEKANDLCAISIDTGNKHDQILNPNYEFVCEIIRYGPK